ncbi:MAG: hypothetical protein ACKOFD_08755 [Actinomycetota bacterium]
MREVTTTDIETYRLQGVVVLRQVLDADLLTQIGEGIDDNMASPSSWSNEEAERKSPALGGAVSRV